MSSRAEAFPASTRITVVHASSAAGTTVLAGPGTDGDLLLQDRGEFADADRVVTALDKPSVKQHSRGVGPAVAATVIGDVRDISRFPSRDRFAA